MKFLVYILPVFEGGRSFLSGTSIKTSKNANLGTLFSRKRYLYATTI
jgi:hypothetical protein